MKELFENSCTKSKKDSGYAWVIVLQGFIGASLSFGGIFAFGVFLPLYVDSLNTSPASVSFIGTTAVFVSEFCCLIAGPLTDKFGPRKVLIASAIVSALGYFCASLSTTLWQLILSQGLLVGIGASGAFVASQAAVAIWFDKMRSLAMGISGSGVAFGSVFIVAIVNALLTNHGLKYALQVLALFELVSLLFAAFLTSRFDDSAVKNESSDTVPQSSFIIPELFTTESAGSSFWFHRNNTAVSNHMVPKVEEGNVSDDVQDVQSNQASVRVEVTTQSQQQSSLFGNKTYVYVLIAFGVITFGCSIPGFYLPLYGQLSGYSVVLSNYLVSVAAAASGIGRLLGGLLAQKYNKLVLMQFSALACGALTLGWLAYTNYVALACYAAFYGAFVGIFFVLIGPISADLFPIEQLGTAMGMLIAIGSVGDLVSAPIAGALYGLNDKFYPAIIYISATFFGAALFIYLATRSVPHVEGKTQSRQLPSTINREECSENEQF